MVFRLLLASLLTLCVLASAVAAADDLADKPLYRDPIHDGAADPVVVWNAAEQKWFMFYTNRRANVPGLKGVSWAQGTRIGIAESETGAHWRYRGTANIDYGEGEYSSWAPEVIAHEGTYHMYLTFVPGIHEDWGRVRHILHLTSDNLIDWTFVSKLDLGSDRAIDACVFRLGDGTWRLWYKDEAADSRTFVSESSDLYHWTKGRPMQTEIACEGPKVFHWQDQYWLITDAWNGQAVFHSPDGVAWQRQPENLLQEPGTGLDDMEMGRHADVVVTHGHAYIFYFTHPGRTPDAANIDIYATRRSSIQVAELKLENGSLICDRNAPVHIALTPP
ncbi:MAG: family 43 glycosylhydrolase [Candidatus Hydrogenedentes bacterium]|nr:family 43 glycosylhydrolase [Candidatus Hydrogenedentota bacterium]